MEMVLLALANDYKWILIAFILVVMLIIGYIADATDFGHKKLVRNKKEKPIKNPNKVEEIKTDDLTRNDKIVSRDEDLNVPFGDTIKLPKIEEENIVPIDEDLTKPIEEVIPSSDIPTVEEILAKDLDAPVDAIPELDKNIEDVNINEVKDIDETPVEEIEAKPEKVSKKEVKKIDNPKKGKGTKEKVVPEFIAEQYNPSGEVSSDDDIWNF